MTTDKILAKLSYVFYDLEKRESKREKADWEKAKVKAEREWFGAISAVENILLSTIDTDKPQYQGLLICGPTPILSNSQLNSHLHIGIFTPEDALIPFQLTGSSQATVTCTCISPPLGKLRVNFSINPVNTWSNIPGSLTIVGNFWGKMTSSITLRLFACFCQRGILC